MQQASEFREDLLRNAIIDATIVCIDAKGGDKVRIGDVANELGIARQTIYNYFANKNELLNETFAREAVSLAVRSGEFIEQFDDVGEKFVQAFVFVVNEFPASPVLNHVIQTSGRFMQEFGISRQLMQQFGEMALQKVLDEYPFLKAQSEEVCELFSRNIMSFLLMPDQAPRSDEELMAFVRRRLLPGIGLSAEISK